jgi:hypothetical protein
MPDLTPASQAFLRGAYGVLLLGTLLRVLPHGRRYFHSERWGGYAQSSRAVDLLQNPWVYPLLMTVWLIAAALLVVGARPVWAAAVNLALCYYFFVWMRWRGVLRGMGAPGFMTFWLGAAVFFLEFTSHHAPQCRSLALLMFQADYALIMFSAGVYKWTAGYARNEGMEYGMVNPQWGYFHRFWRRLRPGNPLFAVQNQLAWSVEIVAAVLMLIPATRLLGAAMIILSFVYIATQIRLCLLTEMVMVGGILFLAPGTGPQLLLDALSPWGAAVSSATPAPPWLVGTIKVWLWAYLALLPLAHGGLFWNFYTGKRLWRTVQILLERYTNAFGLIIWRVFSADHTNFYLRIYRQVRDHSEPPVLVSNYDAFLGRYQHVAESITLTSVFTSLKYYAGNAALFHERLLRYARTIRCSDDEQLLFEYVSIRKIDGRFVDVPTAEFAVDLQAGTVTERPLQNDTRCLRSGVPGSPLRQGSRPGSYAA